MVGAAPHRRSAGVGRYTHGRAAFAQLLRTRARHADVRPAVDAATGTVVIADARIDNVPELRAALGGDAPAEDATDAVVIAAAYRRWGYACLPRLLGDFAFVLWDPTRDRLLLARDPMAMRALYYRVETDRVLVATEIAQLLAVPGVPDDPDERMAAAYLAGCFGSLEWTWYRGIGQVAPGHALAVEQGRVRSWRFWDAEPDDEIVYPREEEYAEHLRALFVDAVRVRMRGNHPMGVLLSGGIDSGAVASVAGWLHEREGLAPALRSYSFDYGPLESSDERQASRHIVDRYGMTGTDVFAADAGPLAGYPAHAPDADDPFHGHFQTLLDRTFLRADRDGVGPLFTGMRGDLAIGPVDEDYRTLLRARRWGALADEVRRHAATSSASVAGVVGHHVLPHVLRAVRRRATSGWVRPGVVGARQDGRVRDSPPWITSELARRVDLHGILAAYSDAPAPPLRGILRRRRYQWVFMPMHLRWAVSHERRVARHGMEAVDAWSDRRIAEFCIAVPQHAIDRPTAVDKRLARAAIRPMTPPSFLQAAGKTVPTPLFEGTLRTSAVPTVRTLLTDSRAEAAGWIDAGILRDHYEEFVAGGPARDELWWALATEWWLRNHGSPAPCCGD